MRLAIKVIYLNFFLLIALIYASHPIEKAIDRLTNKYRIQEQKKVCLRILDKKEEYIDSISYIWTSGCVYESKILLQTHAVGDIKKLNEIEVMYKDQNSLEFKKIKDECSRVSSLYISQFEVEEKIIKDLVEHFQCEKLDWNEK